MTDEALDLTIVRRDDDVLRWLRSHRRLGLLSTAVDLMDLAFRHGGYVAGGFARIVVGIKDGNIPNKNGSIFHGYDNDVIAVLHDYLKCYDAPSNQFDNRGDIDVFFRDAAEFAKFMDASVTTRQDLSIRVFPHGRTIWIHDRIKLQAIRDFAGKPADVLANFDIDNARVAFDGHNTWRATCCDALERKGLLSCSRWNSPYTVWRVKKWLRKHRLQRLTPRTSDCLINTALNLLSQHEVGHNRHYQVKHWLRGMVKALSIEDHLLLTHLADDQSNAYDGLSMASVIARSSS